MMYLSDAETVVNTNFRDEQVAYYAAQAGLQEARDRMRTNAGSGITINSSLPTAQPGAVNGVLYILNPTGSETVAPWTTTNAYFDDEICKEVSCGAGQVPPTSGWYVSPALTASSTYAATPVIPYKWMRITLKTNKSAVGTSNVMYVDGNSAHAAYYVCWNGTNEVASSTACSGSNKPVYELTSLAVTTSGTRRMMQTELTQDSLNLSFPGALTLDGTGDVMSGPNSNPYQMQGADSAGCGGAATGTTVPAIAVNDARRSDHRHRRHPVQPTESLHRQRSGSGRGCRYHAHELSIRGQPQQPARRRSSRTSRNPCLPGTRAAFRRLTSAALATRKSFM